MTTIDIAKSSVSELGRDLAQALGRKTGRSFKATTCRAGGGLTFCLIDTTDDEGREWLRTTAASWRELAGNVASLHLASMI